VSGIEVAFFGSLGRDAEAKTSKAGKPYLRMSMRVGDGEAVQWISVLAFDAKAAGQPDKFVAGARLYVEGTLRVEEWTGQDGTRRHGLSVMSWHCRLAEIGRNRPKRDKGERKSAADGKPGAAPPTRNNFHDDEIPF
jgi:single-stranded DNA-binding protein